MDFNATNEAPYHGIWIESLVKFKFDSEFRKTPYPWTRTSSLTRFRAVTSQPSTTCQSAVTTISRCNDIVVFARRRGEDQ